MRDREKTLMPKVPSVPYESLAFVGMPRDRVGAALGWWGEQGRGSPHYCQIKC